MEKVISLKTEKDIYPSESVLLMEIGETDCCFGIMHHASRILYEIAYYKNGDATELLKKIFQKHDLLRGSFYRTAISWYMPECILFPNKYFDPQQSKVLLDEMFGKDSTVSVSESLAEWQVAAAYHIPAAAHNAINRQYTTGNFWH